MARPWYGRHMEALAVTFPGRGLSTLTGDEITGYLRALARRPDLRAWRLRQQVDAIQLLLVDLVGSEK